MKRPTSGTPRRHGARASARLTPSLLAPQALVVVYMANPRERYWGRLEALNQVGVFLRGMDLAMVEEWAREIARGDDVLIGVSTVFFPLTRVEKVFLDEESGAARSMRDTFRAIVGSDPDPYLG